MKLENAKHLIDEYFESKSEEELEEFFRKYFPSINTVDSEEKEVVYTEKDMKQYAWECVANFLSNSENKVEQSLMEIIIARNDDVFKKINQTSK